jgi:protein TonB
LFEHVEGIRRKNRRGTLPAVGVAALVHVLLLALLVWGVRENVLMAGAPVGDGPALAFPEGGGGGGGGRGGEEMVSYVDLAPPPPAETVEVEPVPEEDVLVPPEPTPVPEPPKPQAPQVETPAVRPAAPAPTTPAPRGDGAGTGGGEGPGQGPGTGPGVGPGSGGGSGGGDGGGIGSGTGPGTGGGGSRIRPPQTDLLIIPPDRPRGMPSRTLTITLRVDIRGRVRNAQLSESTGNRGYDDRVRRWAMDLVFRPAVNIDTNRPEEVDYPITVDI